MQHAAWTWDKIILVDLKVSLVASAAASDVFFFNNVTPSRAIDLTRPDSSSMLVIIDCMLEEHSSSVSSINTVNMDFTFATVLQHIFARYFNA